MAESPGTLRLRVLLCFLQKDKVCNVMGISRTLKEPKQTISRTLIALEKDGLIDRSNLRNPILTEKGQVRASYYAERMEVMLNHLLYEGVDINSARQDALQWALYSSDKAMETIRATEERYRVKYELRNQKQFSGRQLCRLLKDGVYQFPFLIYREHVKNGTNISMANEGFEHPCTLYVDGGEGLIQLRALSISAKSGSDGNVMSGRAQSMQYFDSGRFIDSEINGNVFSFPADVLNFVNMGNGVGQILHGSCPVKIECSVGLIHMPESTAIFTILI
jgi:Mn-dependent DtxR family transcriptional regulator